MRNTLAACILVLASATTAAAQSAVILVRHAERADTGGASPGMMAADPDLSPAGHARAEALAALLKDAKITAIYTTDVKRTRQTAGPIAKAIGIEPTSLPAADSAALLQRIQSAAGNVLVVGHSNTIPDLIRGLGVNEAVTIGDQEFDNLFVIFRGTPTLLRLRY
jgi:broad specificity phosphatase PhoE